MKEPIYFIFFVLISVLLYSCDQENTKTIQKQTIHQPANNAILSDAAKLELYYAWSEKIEYINAFDYDDSLLFRTERNRDTVLLQAFLSANYDSIKYYEEFPYQPADLIKYLYALDFNGDSLLDIFYQGPTGAEPTIIHLFLNRGDYYTKVFSGYQKITNINFEGNKLTSFTLLNPGCCADPQMVEYYYSLSYNDSLPQFNLTRTIGYLSQTEKVKNLFSQPKEFLITFNHAKLRHDSYIMDDIENPLFGNIGNILALYKKGSKGKAIGYKMDNGTEWLYSLMDANNTKENFNYPTFEEQPTQLYGWVLKSDSDLK